jgi:GNAT superfamily N-acetyltransferase
MNIVPEAAAPPGHGSVILCPVSVTQTGAEPLRARVLARHEIERIWRIDRSEINHHIYTLRGGDLVRAPAYFELRGWPAEQVSEDTPRLYACFDRGGSFIGMFAGEELVGVAVVDTLPLGAELDQLQLKYLYVSRPHRGRGVGRRLLGQAKAHAQRLGAKALYVSATPTESTVDFYRHCGAVLAEHPDPELYALEPQDIHMICGF